MDRQTDGETDKQMNRQMTVKWSVSITSDEKKDDECLFMW